MIKWIGHFSTSWVARGFFLFLAVSFALMWGGGDLARRIGLGEVTIASVGGEAITEQEFQKALALELNQLQIKTHETIDAEKAKKMGLYKLVLENLINEKLISKEAERLGIRVTDDFIRQFIKKDASFSDPAGTFSRDRFQTLIHRLGFTEEAYIGILRKELVKERLFQGLTEGVEAPLTLTFPLFAWQQERRQVNILTIRPSQQKAVKKPTAEELRTFYDTHENLFIAPEFRDLKALLLNAEDVLATLTVSEADLKSSFQGRSEEFKGKDFQQVKALLEKEIKQQRLADEVYQFSTKIEDAIAAGQSLEEIAKKYQLTFLIFKAIDRTGQVDPYSGQAATLEPRKQQEMAIIEEGFRQQKGEAPTMIEATENQYFAVQVDKVVKKHKRPFQEVSEKVKEFWTKAQQLDQSQTLAAQIVQEINAGGLVAALANRYQLQRATILINRQGVRPPSTLFLPPHFLDQLFFLHKGQAGFSSVQGDQADPVYFQVGVVETIEAGNADQSPEEVKKFQSHLKNLLQEDFLIQYLYALRKRFPVEINMTFQSKILVPS